VGLLIKLFGVACTLSREWLREYLWEMDAEIQKNLPRGRYELHGIRTRTLETVIGPVEIRRRYYRDRETGGYVFLLDRALGLKGCVRVGPVLQEVVAQCSTDCSFRGVADFLARIYNRPVLSHEGVRQTAHRVARGIRAEQARVCARPEGQERREALFVAADGLIVRLQGAKQKVREVKLAVAFEDWERRRPGADDEWQLVRPMYCMTAGKDIWEQFSRRMYSRYDIDGNTPVVICGDGAGWIAKGLEWFPRALFQYDRFHLMREVRRTLSHLPHRLGAAVRAMQRGDVDGLLSQLLQAADETTDSDRGRDLEALYFRYSAQKDSLVDYRVRLRAESVDTTGMRGLGIAESQVNRVKNRLGKKGRSWSEEGVGAMLTILCSWLEGTLAQYAGRCGGDTELEPVRSVDEVRQERVGRGDPGGVRSGHFPALDHGTKGFAPLFRKLKEVPVNF